jgi:hypothetical protein
MKQYLLKAFKWLYRSFEADSKAKGVASARKLTTFSIFLLAAYSHIKYVDTSNVEAVLFWDYTAIFVLLGLVTLQDAINAKNKNNDNEEKKLGKD